MAMKPYNPAMHVAVISDVHCAGPEDPIQRKFVSWLDELEADALWMLGDIFHWGWGFGGAAQAAVQPVVDALERAQSRQVALLFVGGNHDFALAEVLAGVGIEVRGPHTRDVDGRTVFLAHGDEADRTVGYRLTQWVLRGPLFGGVVGVMGEKRGSRLLAHLAGDQKTDLWDEADRRARDWLAGKLGEGTTLAICGHFHLASQESHPEGEVVTLGAGGPRSAVWLIDGAVTAGR
jgi:UDP-2,3-diacylglucosamine pyrophosphatase LpxH